MRVSRLFVAISMLVAIFPSISSAQSPCPGGHLATTQESAAASPPGSIIAGTTWVCPGDAALGINSDAGAAKTYLRSILCPPDRDNYGGMGPDETIRKLDAKFAVCAARFLKAMNTSGSPYCIREGARTVEKQNSYVVRGVIACTKGAQCEHPRGIAIDINVAANPKAPCSEYQRAHTAASGYGVTFYLGCKDAYHFVPATAACSSGGVKAPTGPSIPGQPATQPGQLPPSYYDFPQFAPSANPFQTGLTSMVMSALPSLLASQLAPSVQPATLTPVSPIVQINPTTLTPDAAVTPVSPITPITPVSPVSPITPVTTSGSIQTQTGTSTPFNQLQSSLTAQTGSNNPLTALDQLLQIAGGSQTGTNTNIQTSTSGPVQLNDDLTDVAIDGAVSASSSVTPTSNLSFGQIQTSSGEPIGSVKNNEVYVQQTFTQHASSANPLPSLGQNTTNPMIKVLTAIRDFLVLFLQYLQTTHRVVPGSWNPYARTA